MNFKNWIKKGFVSIEAVITGAIILSVGFVALSNLSVNGSTVVRNSLNKLDALGVFEEVQQDSPADMTFTLAYVDYFNKSLFYTGDYETVDFPAGIKIAGVVLNVNNGTGTDYSVESAKLLYPVGQEITRMSTDIKNDYAPHLVALPAGQSTQKTLYFQVPEFGPNIFANSKADLAIVLTFSNGETLTLNNIIGQ